MREGDTEGKHGRKVEVRVRKTDEREEKENE